MKSAADAALDHVRVLAAASYQQVPSAAMGRVRRTGTVTVNFHPDRPARDGRTAAQALADDGIYRSQFETGTSAGGLDAVMSGARSRWESAMFGGAYDRAPLGDRPRYGGLDLVGYATGACPRFGSCHLRLRTSLREHTTYTFGDSATEPEAAGTWDALESVIAAALHDGMPEVRGTQEHTGRLDRYIEAQIHRAVLVATDVAALVADPSFRETGVGNDLARLSARHGVPIVWHHGYVLDPDTLDPQFRTELSPVLAQDVHDRLARPGQRLDAELVGRAVQDVLRSPRDWAAYGDEVQVLQELKYLWHHLVELGAPANVTAAATGPVDQRTRS
ncbi:DUF3626 domain-containing protein [Luteipulveratus sp. YIM 133132]|uniref:DUF3626 domain-containing protein n=1 Tax=Luteipulveratus flavus TaxID=3031728 RepID=UPI0023B0B439|nr:DUF3626 domain-containing protein [Luteipulveratus sp. YIM 133132]MDE9366233.1 DUF3626 domain-containing protein [Luteipulveratus sp. YIM 133132]